MFFKTGEMKVETIKKCRELEIKKELKELISDGLDLFREESNKNSGTYVPRISFYIYT